MDRIKPPNYKNSLVVFYVLYNLINYVKYDIIIEKIRFRRYALYEGYCDSERERNRLSEV